ncbi:MAG: hypothetical protein ACRDSH_23810, partial [Pseudonocardiaceae bacterium]
LNAVKGGIYTITITTTTTFGTKNAPATAQSFPIGAPVLVMGKHSGTTINATRIATPAKRGTAKTNPSHPQRPPADNSAHNPGDVRCRQGRGRQAVPPDHRVTVSLLPTTDEVGCMAWGTRWSRLSALTDRCCQIARGGSR